MVVSNVVKRFPPNAKKTFSLHLLCVRPAVPKNSFSGWRPMGKYESSRET